MDLVDEFMQLTAEEASVAIFRQWAGITLVSAALSRKAFSRVVGIPTYPNLFTLLVGTPGTGKSRAIRAAQEIAREVFDPAHIAPDSLTVRRLTALMSSAVNIEAKAEGKIKRKRSDLPPEVTVARHELLSKMVVFSSEFGAFLKETDQEMMKVLSDLFDCPSEYHHETQHHGQDHIYNAYLTILGGVQPWWFSKLPHTAFEQGLPSRLIIVHSDEEIEPELFVETDFEMARHRLNAIKARLDAIQTIEGEFYWYPAAKEEMKAWNSRRHEHAPRHPLLLGYGRRRRELLIRLAMIAGASRAAKPEVSKQDVERAIHWLHSAEKTTPKALESAGASPYHHHEIVLTKFVAAEFNRTECPVPEPTVRRHLARNVPPNLVDVLIEGLLAQGLLMAVGQEKSPHRRFIPGKQDE